MRHLVIAFALAGALALPAIASDDINRFEEMTMRWEATPGQSRWVEPAVLEPIYAEPIEAVAPGAARAGDGWAALDGWMRGDPTLRHWVMHRFDLNADGWLAGDEAMAARRAFYRIADTNRSDLITSEEFVAGWSSVRQELRSFYAVDLHDA